MRGPSTTSSGWISHSSRPSSSTPVGTVDIGGGGGGGSARKLREGERAKTERESVCVCVVCVWGGAGGGGAQHVVHASVWVFSTEGNVSNVPQNGKKGCWKEE
jgi:hypothetical protein